MLVETRAEADRYARRVVELDGRRFRAIAELEGRAVVR